jgi:hypothetical protein
MSAGHSLRRQNYSFVTLTTPTASPSSSTAWHSMRVIVVVISAVALDLASFATLSMLITGR